MENALLNTQQSEGDLFKHRLGELLTAMQASYDRALYQAFVYCWENRTVVDSHGWDLVEVFDDIRQKSKVSKKATTQFGSWLRVRQNVTDTTFARLSMDEAVWIGRSVRNGAEGLIEKVVQVYVGRSTSGRQTIKNVVREAGAGKIPSVDAKKSITVKAAVSKLREMQAVFDGVRQASTLEQAHDLAEKYGQELADWLAERDIERLN